MAAPLNTCTTTEQRGVVGYSRQEIHNWVQKFSEGRTSIEDEHRAGRPVQIATPETFRRQPKEFYAAGFQGLVKRWDKCLNLYGDYVEK